MLRQAKKTVHLHLLAKRSSKSFCPVGMCPPAASISLSTLTGLASLPPRPNLKRSNSSTIDIRPVLVVNGNNTPRAERLPASLPAKPVESPEHPKPTSSTDGRAELAAAATIGSIQNGLPPRPNLDTTRRDSSRKESTRDRD